MNSEMQEIINETVSKAIVQQAIVIKAILTLLLDGEVISKDKFDERVEEVAKGYKDVVEKHRFHPGVRLDPEDWDSLISKE